MVINDSKYYKFNPSKTVSTLYFLQAENFHPRKIWAAAP